MAALGNKNDPWRNLSNGQHPFASPQELLEAAQGYFAWCDEHPLLEEETTAYQGDVTRFDKKKVRPYTLKGMAVYLNIAVKKLEKYRLDDSGFAPAMELVDQVMYTQKFEHAAAGIMNSNFISRDLGLAEKQEITGKDSGPIQVEEISARERVNSKLASLATRISADRDTGEPQQ